MTAEECRAYIQENLSYPELWGQLAEEAAELAQAALKMQRSCMGTNPPRKDRIQCVKDVCEEHADVELCFQLLDWEHCDEPIQEEKLLRWVKHIQSIKGDTQC